MRLVVLADIHSNLSALETVLTQVDDLSPDEVVVAGDIVNRGPRPRECLERVFELQRTRGWHLLRGNHEDFVLLAGRDNDFLQPWETEVYEHTRWTFERIKDYRDDIEALPHQIELGGPEGKDVRILHASMRGNRRGVYPRMEDEEIHELIAPLPSVTCVGHTHVPFIRPLGKNMVVNVGAVGLPFDRDERAAYAVLEWHGGSWHAEVVRIPYDRERGRQDFFDTGYHAGGGQMVRLILDEYDRARPHLSRWHRDYEARVATGEMTVEESVTSMLEGA